MPLPFCVDEPGRTVLFPADVHACCDWQKLFSGPMTGHSEQRVAPLYRGIRMVQAASCAQLANVSFLVSAVETTGLKYDRRGPALYGASASFMLVANARKTWAPSTGLWQEPTQFARALLHLGSLPREVRTYFELGCATGWTGALLAAYMQRVGHRLRGLLVDLNAAPPSAVKLISPLLDRLHLTYVGRQSPALARGRAEDKLALVASLHHNRSGHAGSPGGGGGGGGGGASRFDLCFVDAQHSYEGVRSDFEEFAPHCSTSFFHDIRDADTMHLANYSGGVPAFWHHLRERVRPARVVEYTSQLSEAQPVFGIGVLAPNRAGTAEPETPFSAWPAWRGGGPAAFREAFCAPPQHHFVELC